MTISAAVRVGKGTRDQLCTLMGPPLWPVGPEVFSAKVNFVYRYADFFLGPVHVFMLAGNHPGGCTTFRLEHAGKSLVYATDYELTGESVQRLRHFASGCTLLLCDGQYFPDEIDQRRGFGHSTWEEAVDVALLANVQTLGIIHHDPSHDDVCLEAAEQQMRQLMTNSFFAREGERRSF